MTLILDACCFPYITYTMCGLWIRPLLMFECLCCPSHFPVADSAFISIPVFALPRIIVVYVFPLVTSAIIFQSRRGTIFLPLSPCFPILLTPPHTFSTDGTPATLPPAHLTASTLVPFYSATHCSISRWPF